MGQSGRSGGTLRLRMFLDRAFNITDEDMQITEKGGNAKFPATAATGLLILVASFIMYMSLLARVVNPDGLHQAKAVNYYSLNYLFAPGHLLSGPLSKGFWHLWQSLGYQGNPVLPMQVLSATGGAAGVFFFFLATTSLFPSRRLQVFLTALLATSFGYWYESTDVETYAMAMGLLMLSLWLLLKAARRLSALWLILAGIAAAGATLIHITNIVWILFACTVTVALWSRRKEAGTARQRWIIPLRNALIPVFSQIAVVGAAYYFVFKTFVVQHQPRGDTLDGMVRWFSSADHGYVYGFAMTNIFEAFFGMARAVLFVNHSFEAPAWAMSLRLLAFYGLLALIVVLGVTSKKRISTTIRRFSIAAALGSLPYIYIGLQFFANDLERWIWLVPLLLLVSGGVIEIWAGKNRLISKALKQCIAGAVLLALVANNLFGMILPLHLEDSWYRRASFAAKFLRDGDLLLNPGHSWGDYVWMFNDLDYRQQSLVHFAYQDNVNFIDIFQAPDAPETEQTSLDKIIGKTLSAGHDVYAVRVFEDHDTFHGWGESRKKGFTGDAREELVKYFNNLLAKKQMEKFFLSYFSLDGRLGLLEKQLGESGTRRIAQNYLPLFRKYSSADLSYFLNREEYNQAKQYFDTLDGSASVKTAANADPYLIWRSLKMVPLDARLYKLYLSQYKWTEAGAITDKGQSFKVWRLMKPGPGD